MKDERKPKKPESVETHKCEECGGKATTAYYGIGSLGNEEYHTTCENPQCPSNRRKKSFENTNVSHLGMKFEEYYLMREAVLPMSLNESVTVSENLQYHLENNLSISDSVFRMGSTAWCELVNEVRSLHESGKIALNENDEFIVLTEAGRTGVYQGKQVPLDSPKRGGPKKFYVFVNSGRKNAEGRVVAKKVAWGDPNLSVKNQSDKARKSFLARHKCSEKHDRTTPGWWACNVNRYAKQLGLTSTKRW